MELLKTLQFGDTGDNNGSSYYCSNCVVNYLFSKASLMGYYAKAIAAFLTAISTWGATSLADDSIKGGEWFGLFGVLGVTFAVYQVRNTPLPE